VEFFELSVGTVLQAVNPSVSRNSIARSRREKRFDLDILSSLVFNDYILYYRQEKSQDKSVCDLSAIRIRQPV